ncbi:MULTISPECIES: hypothetical protein [Brevibacillus]|jgi:hypothetical protein|uniref:Uncharacterized protein n=1 Tax=Brevibacillus parabrevis TaxID=54914 RepID=A0A4Y3PKD6_BREPA|nr:MULTISPECIES: hypothetical protein [Brevibacillus]MED1725245.1 hypothetical protein [Brevibacillus parabrevis]RNB92194.1 hypothetical protein EDM60_26645 [Brevibacillus parabrevis]UED69561.1 hypothetical protein HP435_02500 [Brevibacillus sp. HD3.3A]GEB33874.1 hypothetical protein BPA01_34540 [Brevibacillus parabrevis]HBZ82173.1 hypothetical protein [Brevibacillus sp.]
MATGDCTLYGVHKMYMVSRAIIKNKYTGNTINSHWSYYKCRCGDLFACSGAPQLGEPILDYLTNHYMNGAGQSGIITIHVDPSDINNTSKRTLPGFDFIP